jgi:hypothetical protein
MMGTAPTILPIFSVPFGIVPLAEAGRVNSALRALFMQRAAADGRPQQNPLRYQSSDRLFEWPEEAVRTLREAILGGVIAVISGVNDLTQAQLDSFKLEARGWFTVIKPDGSVPATLYPLTAWCAVYCVSAPPPSPTRADSGMLRLYESRLGTMFQDATTAQMRIPFRAAHYAWRPVAGELAVFPAYLTHEIALLRAAEELVLVTARLRFIAPGQTGMGRW